MSPGVGEGVRAPVRAENQGEGSLRVWVGGINTQESGRLGSVEKSGAREELLRNVSTCHGSDP